MKMLGDLALCRLTIVFISSLSLLMAEPVAEAEEKEFKSERHRKVLPVFQIVKFPNDPCIGATKNGTCYTPEECSNKGGANEGACASGFGVCCHFSLSCGSSSSENGSHIYQTSVTTLTSPCTFTICPCSSNICRIRYDFTNFVLAGAVAGTTRAGATLTASASLIGPAIGDCVEDQFSISSPGFAGSPVICGTNTGYHMILDADNTGQACQRVNFQIGGSAVTRSWDIRVTQYGCGDFDVSGYPGCLQYYTQTTNTIQNFAWPPGAAAVTAGFTHLSSQHYDICIRRGLNFCYICYSVHINSAAAIVADTQHSFGLGLSANAAAAQSRTSSLCTLDWIEIPSANTLVIAMAEQTAGGVPAALMPTTNNSKFCGRYFNVAPGAAATVEVCSRVTPFRVGVHFNDDEVDPPAAAMLADAKGDVVEASEAPGGITGFRLTYRQVAC